MTLELVGGQAGSTLGEGREGWIGGRMGGGGGGWVVVVGVVEERVVGPIGGDPSTWKKALACST